MEVVGLVVGLVAAATILPMLLLVCATKQKEAPIGASMANRRAAAQGRVQIDPLLKPDWAAKRAVQNAQERQEHAVKLSAKNLWTARGTSGGDEPTFVTLRQPSTMADRFALPSHLTKQLGQSSRRTMGPRSYTATQDDSSGRRTPLFEPSPMLQRPEPALRDSPVASGTSRSPARDANTHDRSSAGGICRPAANNSSSRRMTIASPARLAGDGSVASGERDSLDVVQLGGEGILRDGGEDFGPPAALNSRQVNGAWPGLNDPAVVSRVAGGSGAPSPAPVPAPAALISPLHHPRVAALSPGVRGSPSPARGPVDGSFGRRGSRSPSPLQQLHEQQQQQPEPRASRTSNLVEQLVAGSDWSSAAPGDGERRASVGAIGALLDDESGRGPPREQYSAPPSAGRGAIRIRHATVAGVTGERDVCSTNRDDVVRSADRLGGSSFGAASAAGMRGVPASSSCRWTGPGSASGSLSSAAVGSRVLPPSLPGSADSSLYPVEAPQLGEEGMEDDVPQSRHFHPPSQAQPRFGSVPRARGLSLGAQTAPTAAAVARSGSAAESNVVSGARGNATWSGAVGPAPADGDGAGPRAPGGGGADTILLGSRAARAQALLARNRSNLSRLAAATAPAGPVIAG